MTAEEQIINNHEKAKKLVDECLSEDDRAKNDDMWLCLQVWRKQGIKVFVDYSQMKEMFNPETIIRNRAFIQNDEVRHLPTLPEVLRKRKMKESVIKAYYGEQHEIFKDYQNLAYGVK